MVPPVTTLFLPLSLFGQMGPLRPKLSVVGLISAILVSTILFVSSLCSRVSADCLTDFNPFVHCLVSRIYVDASISTLREHVCCRPLCLSEAHHRCCVFRWHSEVESYGVRGRCREPL